jgi:hypothetical protein
MRWDALFDDLDAQAEALSTADRAAEMADRGRFETGRLTLVDRLLPAIGATVQLRCAGALSVTGRLGRVHPEWLLLAEDAGREALVAVAALVSIGGLGRGSAAPGSQSAVDARLSLRQALRAIARDRSSVRIHLIGGGVLDGTLDRVGADFVELAEHPVGEPRRPAEITGMLAVAVASIAVVRRDG